MSFVESRRIGFVNVCFKPGRTHCRSCRVSSSSSAWLCDWPSTTSRRMSIAVPISRPAVIRMADPQDVENDIKREAESRMSKTIDATSSSFNTIRTGRASASILDRVTVDYYDTETPLKQLATVSVSGGNTIVIDAYDKSCIKQIERALMESDIGIMPSNAGDVIRLTVPPLTKERRKELAKQVKVLAEEGRVALRNIRRDAVDKCKKLEKDKEISQDGSKNIQDALQKLTDKYVKKIEDLFKEKEKDIMTV